MGGGDLDGVATAKNCYFPTRFAPKEIATALAAGAADGTQPIGCDRPEDVSPAIDQQHVHRHRVIGMGEILDGQHRLVRGDHLDGGQQDSRRVTGWLVFGAGWFRDQAAEAGSFPRLQEDDLPGGTDDTCMNPGDSRFQLALVDDVARQKIVGSVDHQMAISEQILRVPPGQIGDLYLCLQIVPDRLQVGSSGDRLGESLSGIGVGVEDLPREIVCLHPVAIDQLQVADAAAGQLHRYRGA